MQVGFHCLRSDSLDGSMPRLSRECQIAAQIRNQVQRREGILAKSLYNVT
jgi:hypothetical protein